MKHPWICRLGFAMREILKRDIKILERVCSREREKRAIESESLNGNIFGVSNFRFLINFLPTPFAIRKTPTFSGIRASFTRYTCKLPIREIPLFIFIFLYKIKRKYQSYDSLGFSKIILEVKNLVR